MKAVVIIAALLALTTCTLHGPIAIDATYPGYFRITMSLVRPGISAWLPSTEFQTYQGEFDTTDSLLEVTVYADKNPPDVAPQ